MVSNMEKVEMPVGLFAAIKGLVQSLPAAAFGNAPASAVADLLNKINECKVVEAEDGK